MLRQLLLAALLAAFAAGQTAARDWFQLTDPEPPLARPQPPVNARAQRPRDQSSDKTPRENSFSSERLNRIGEVFGKAVSAKKLPGAVLMVAHKGQIVY